MGLSDRRNAGRSDSVPFLMGESAKDRHRRRKHAATGEADAALKWAEDNDISIVVRNDGHHWQFHFVDSSHVAHVAEWWPSSAKLVFDKHWVDGIHCHDIEQVKRQILKCAQEVR